MINRETAEMWVSDRLADPRTLEEPDELMVVAHLAGQEYAEKKMEDQMIKDMCHWLRTNWSCEPAALDIADALEYDEEKEWRKKP